MQIQRIGVRSGPEDNSLDGAHETGKPVFPLEPMARDVVLAFQALSDPYADEHAVAELQTLQLPVNELEIVIVELAGERREQVRERLRPEIGSAPEAYPFDSGPAICSVSEAGRA
jgi:hypothetical protein